MSKLFDQLKDAARDREGGLLMGALARKQAEETAAAAAAASAQAEPQAPVPVPTPVRDKAAPLAAAPASAFGTPLVGVALAATIFGIAVLAWHSAPWRAPQKLKIDADSLKLDRKLDLERPSPKGTTSPSRPS